MTMKADLGWTTSVDDAERWSRGNNPTALTTKIACQIRRRVSQQLGDLGQYCLANARWVDTRFERLATANPKVAEAGGWIDLENQPQGYRPPY